MFRVVLKQEETVLASLKQLHSPLL
jgi:hypothetical protein